LESLLMSDTDSPLLTDFYEITMAAAYFESGQKDRVGVFEMFVRNFPRNRRYLVAAGLEQVIHYLLNFRFSPSHISFLKSQKELKHVSENFYDYLRGLRFTGNVWAIPEGTIFFPNEPVIRVEAPIIESQIIETYLLSTINFQTLIATKASRIVSSAGNSPNASVLAARASFIAGCSGTSNSFAGYKLGIPVSGTMAHSFIMNYDSELDAFSEFSKVFPSATLLVDTYDPFKAISKIIDSRMSVACVRIDSGDLLSTSKKIRRILDSSGYASTKIMASGNLNEYSIGDLLAKSAPIDYFGVGTELATSRDDPALEGVYKLVAIKSRLKGDQEFQISYKQKTSPGKTTYPAPKQVFRILRDGIIDRDVLTVEGDTVDQGISLLLQYMDTGKVIRALPSLKSIRSKHREGLKALPAALREIHSESESSSTIVVIGKKLKQIIGEPDTKLVL
jgi:nicotinate phosphoribosyltransferase